MNPGLSNTELTILMPCLNEAETLATCISKGNSFLHKTGIEGEIVVADNGSSDGSQNIAEQYGARVVHVSERGYGAALIGGILAAKGEFIIMGDADDSYDFSNLDEFIQKLSEGYDLVMGNRFKGGIKKNAMPFLHKYLGNPILSGIGRLFFQCPIGDLHCGLRGFRKEPIQKLDLQTTGMEFASEMVVKATLYNLAITEVPTILYPDGRSRSPHLHTWSDGWRHLRFLLLYSPRWLFFYPGIMLMLIGISVTVWLLLKPRTIGNVTLDINTLLYATLAILVGFQATTFALFTKLFGIYEKLLPDDPKLKKFLKLFSLERGIIIGFGCILLGLFTSIAAFQTWKNLSFGSLNPSKIMRIVIPAVLFLFIGIQTILYSFFASILTLKRRKK